jgi:hypothetical protein
LRHYLVTSFSLPASVGHEARFTLSVRNINYEAVVRGDRRGQAKSLEGIASALHGLGEHARARSRAEAALGVYERVRSPEAARVRQMLERWTEAPNGELFR